MAPTLADGDWLLVDPRAFHGGAPVAGDLAVFSDPRMPERLLVKRVELVTPDGGLTVAGDHPDHVLDPELIGQVAPESVIGRPWLRYRPIGRFGRVR